MLGERKTEQGEKMSPGEETNGNLCRRTLAEEEGRSERKMKETEDENSGREGRTTWREIKSNSRRKENNWLGNIRDGEEK